MNIGRCAKKHQMEERGDLVATEIMDNACH